MIYLKNLLYEIQKNKWIEPKDLDDYKSQILKLIQNAYKDIGGNPNFSSEDDINKAGGQFFSVIDLDDDADIDAVVVYKSKPAGKKSVATGHDGSKPAKSTVVKKVVSDLKKQYYFIEASGRLAEILMGSNIPYIDNEERVRKILKKDIEWIGNGQYKRKIGGKTFTKRLFGDPKI